jgi:hypothetical protein
MTSFVVERARACVPPIASLVNPDISTGLNGNKTPAGEPGEKRMPGAKQNRTFFFSTF